MSTLSNSPSAYTNLRLERTKSFVLYLRFEGKDGTPVDLNQYASFSLSMAPVREPWNAFIYKMGSSFPEAAINELEFRLEAEDLDVTPGSYLWTVSGVTDENYQFVVLKGEVEILENTDPPLELGVSAGYIPIHLAAVLHGKAHVAKVTLSHVPWPKLQLGSVTTGAPGTPAMAEMHGHYPLQTVSLTIPQGLPGLDGIQGSEGPQGPIGLQGPPGIPGNEAIIRLDVDGVPYIVAELVVPGASVQFDTDGVPFLVIGE